MNILSTKFYKFIKFERFSFSSVIFLFLITICFSIRFLSIQSFNNFIRFRFRVVFFISISNGIFKTTFFFFFDVFPNFYSTWSIFSYLYFLLLVCIFVFVCICLIWLYISSTIDISFSSRFFSFVFFLSSSIIYTKWIVIEDFSNFFL